ncbi:hypothetical protein B0H14DRAFT_2309930, partial [Mycena olivaceomarginata]
YPPFGHSVFTTCELSFHEPSLSRVNYDTALESMEAFTSLGSYNYTQGGHLVCWDDKIMFKLCPGTTILIPAGS